MARAPEGCSLPPNIFDCLQKCFTVCLRPVENEAQKTDMSVCSSWSMGSMLFLASWAVLMGPVQYAQHLISAPRLPFTAAYFGSITLTLVFAVKVSVHSPSLTSYVACGFRLDPYPSTLHSLVVAAFETCLLTSLSHDSCKAPS